MQRCDRLKAAAAVTSTGAQAVWSLSIAETQLAGHNHSGAPADAVVEIEHVRIVHANAAVGDEAADRARIIGAVNRVFPTAAERQGGRPHGIARAAAWNDIRQRGLIVL